MLHRTLPDGTSCVWIGHVLKDSGRAKDGSEFEDAFLRQISK